MQNIGTHKWMTAVWGGALVAFSLISLPVFGQEVTVGTVGVPAAVIITTQEGTDAAFRVGDKLADRGIRVLLGRLAPGRVADRQTLLQMAQDAVDSLKRRHDVATEQVGVVLVGDGMRIASDLLADTSLAFAVAIQARPEPACSEETQYTCAAFYAKARIPTLGVLRKSFTTPYVGSHRDSLAQNTLVARVRGTSVVLTERAGTNATIWTFSAAELATVSRPLFPLAEEIVDWVLAQVRAPQARYTEHRAVVIRNDD